MIRILAASLAAVLLAGCERKIECDEYGMRITREDYSAQEISDAQTANLRLSIKRLRRNVDPEGTQWLDPAKLAKADGCP